MELYDRDCRTMARSSCSKSVLHYSARAKTHERNQQMFMKKKINKHSLPHTEADSRLPKHPQTIAGLGGSGSNAVPFRVQANINLYAVAEFIIQAPNKAEAGVIAQKILDTAGFNINREPNDGLDFCVSVHGPCVECEVLEVDQSLGALPPDTAGFRSAG